MGDPDGIAFGPEVAPEALTLVAREAFREIAFFFPAMNVYCGR